MSEVLVKQIHEASMKILEQAGIRFHHPDALKVLKEHGVRVEGGIAYFTEAQVMKYTRMILNMMSFWAATGAGMPRQRGRRRS